MVRAAFVVAGVAAVIAAESHRSSPTLVGTWELVSRTERDSAGRVLSETALGTLPIGYLIYDASGHVAAQLSGRDRSGVVCDSLGKSPDPNNSANISGYSAYFGRYEVDAKAEIVTHTLTGALAPQDVGKHLARHFRIAGDSLTIWFVPLSPDGAPRTRTFVWHRTSR